MKQTTAYVLLTLITPGLLAQQTQPAQKEIDQWKVDRVAQVLESSPCKKITSLLEGEQKLSKDVTHQPVRYALGWWGRGFVEGAVYMVGGDKAQKKADDFGLSVDVVSAHIATHCYAHPNEMPIDAVQDLLLKVLK